MANAAPPSQKSGRLGRTAGRKIELWQRCVVEGSDLVVKMSEIEKFEAMHPDVHVPLSTVREWFAWSRTHGRSCEGFARPGPASRE